MEENDKHKTFIGYLTATNTGVPELWDEMPRLAVLKTGIIGWKGWSSILRASTASGISEKYDLEDFDGNSITECQLNQLTVLSCICVKVTAKKSGWFDAFLARDLDGEFVLNKAEGNSLSWDFKDGLWVESNEGSTCMHSKNSETILKWYELYDVGAGEEIEDLSDCLDPASCCLVRAREIDNHQKRHLYGV